MRVRRAWGSVCAWGLARLSCGLHLLSDWGVGGGWANAHKCNENLQVFFMLRAHARAFFPLHGCCWLMLMYKAFPPKHATPFTSSSQHHHAPLRPRSCRPSMVTPGGMLLAAGCCL